MVGSARTRDTGLRTTGRSDGHGRARRRMVWHAARDACGGVQRGVAALRAPLHRRAGRTLLGCVLATVIGAAAGTVGADDRGLELPGGHVVPPLETRGPLGSTIGIELYDRLRGEFVDWFATPSNGSNSTFRYNFLGNKFQVGLRVKREPYEFFVQFQDTTIGNLPRHGVGFGATYFANTADTLQNGAILRNAWGSTRSLFGVPGLFIKAGRQLYSSAMEAPPKDPSLGWLQANRLSQRLIGPFDWTHTGRCQDGGQVGYDADAWNATVFGFRPTEGGYEVDANRELDVNLIGAVLSKKEFEWLGTTVGQLSYYYHDDFRDVVYVDNRPSAALTADKGRSARIHTIGANLVHVVPLGPGAVDGLTYGYGQFGDWQSLTQHAWAYGAEAGYRLIDVWAKPWLRVGINSASGDTNPKDGTHGTFFQMLPTAQLYANFPFYNMMNDQDVLAQLILQPNPRLSFRLDGHWLRVNSSKDFVYSGGGATSNTNFGYSGTPTNGRNELAYVTHATLGIQATRNVLCNLFYAHAWGQGIIHSNFVGNEANYGYVEMVLTY